MVARYGLLLLGLCCALPLAIGCCGPRSMMGCGSACGDHCGGGRAYAGQIFKGCGTSYVPFGRCTGPACCDVGPGCGCEPGCGIGPGCGVGAGCGCEPACGVDVSCGVDPGCGCGDLGCRPRGLGLFGHGGILGRLFGSSGCSGEIYWSEWHNDPPRCCDPCNRCGEWVGPAAPGSAPTCNCH